MGLRKSNTPDPLREVVDRGFPRHVDGLVAQLRGGDAEQRRWAVRDLTGHPQAAAALGAQLLVERDAAVREAIFLALGTMASDEAQKAAIVRPERASAWAAITPAKPSTGSARVAG